MAFNITEHVIDSQYIREYHRSAATEDASLKLAIKKYTPTDNPNPLPGDVTIIAAHGTGFPKVRAYGIPLTLQCLMNPRAGTLRAIMGGSDRQK